MSLFGTGGGQVTWRRRSWAESGEEERQGTRPRTGLSPEEEDREEEAGETHCDDITRLAIFSIFTDIRTLKITCCGISLYLTDHNFHDLRPPLLLDNLNWLHKILFILEETVELTSCQVSEKQEPINKKLDECGGFDEE